MSGHVGQKWVEYVGPEGDALAAVHAAELLGLAFGEGGGEWSGLGVFVAGRRELWCGEDGASAAFERRCGAEVVHGRMLEDDSGAWDTMAYLEWTAGSTSNCND